jgi:hypothetical protein
MTLRLAGDLTADVFVAVIESARSYTRGRGTPARGVALRDRARRLTGK